MTVPGSLTVCVGLVGPGLVGAALLDQLNQQVSAVAAMTGAKIELSALANSKKMCLSMPGSSLKLSCWRALLDSEGTPSSGTLPTDLERLGEHVGSSNGMCKVVVDCTASDVTPNYYSHWARAGCNIITPNKKFGAGSLDQFSQYQELRKSLRQHFYDEATVGAGLPVLSTLRVLRETGDDVLSVEGVLSGTLSFIFNQMKPGDSFAEVVADAAARGYTEPDPRQDLSGADVARKVVILARHCGVALQMSDLQVDSLVPEVLAGPDVTPSDFMQRLSQHEESVCAMVREATAAGEVVRYVGRVDVVQRTGSVQLSRYPCSHAFGQLNGTDNIVAFTTRRYNTSPLVVRGPGAGAEVTAAGVFGDLLALIGRCGGLS